MHTPAQARADTRLRSRWDTQRMSITDHEILRGDRLGTVLPEIHLAELVTPLSSCGLWVWHVTVYTFEDPSGFSGGEGRWPVF